MRPGEVAIVCGCIIVVMKLRFGGRNWIQGALIEPAMSLHVAIREIDAARAGVINRWIVVIGTFVHVDAKKRTANTSWIDILHQEKIRRRNRSDLAGFVINPILGIGQSAVN